MPNTVYETPDATQTLAPRPPLTIRAGVHEGRVTITATPDTDDRVRVEATWTEDGHRRTTSVILAGSQAQVVAHQWASQLTLGQEPGLAQ
jgi:hypothetical protein